MKALAFTIRFVPAAFALSTLGACGAYSRAYYASHPDQARRASEAAAKTASEEPRKETVVQAGTPAPAARKPTPTPVAVRRGPIPAPAHNEVPNAPAPAPAAAAAAAPVKTARSQKAAKKAEAPRPRETREVVELAPVDQTAASAAMQKRLDQLLGRPNDGQTAGDFMLSNDIVLSFARLALQRSKNEDVMAYARRMITDHTQMITSVQTMLGELDVNPVDDPLSRDLRDWSSFKRDSLLALDPSAFDLSYAQSEVTYHRQFLSLIDDVLVPRASDPAMREQIATMRPVIAAHLAHAERLVAALGRR